MNKTPPSLNPKPILLLDDDEIILHALSEILKDAGYFVKTAQSVNQACTLLEEEDFSIIMSDHRMPVMTGVEFLKHSISLQPNAVRILITGVLTVDTVVAAVNESHIYRFLQKPWMRDAFIETIEEAMNEFDRFETVSQLAEDALRLNEELSMKIHTVFSS